MASAATRSRPGLVIGVLATGGLLAALVQTLLVPLLPQFPHLLSTSPSTVSWLTTSTLIAGAVSAPVFGRLGDMYGKRRMLLVSLALVTIGSALAAVAPGVGVMLVGRTAQGASFAVIALGISIMRDELPPHRIGSGIALMSSSLGIGGAIGLPVTGIVAELVSWRWLFAGVALVGLALTILVLRVVPESPLRSGGRFDTVGAAGLSIGLVCMLLTISKGAEWGWSSATVLGLLGGAAIVLGLWARYELRTRNPLVDLRVTARPTLLLTNIATVLVGFAMFASFVVTTQIMQADPGTGYGFGLSLIGAGLAMVPMGAMMAVLSPASARLSSRRGPRTTLTLGGLSLVAGNLAIAVRPSTLTLLIVATVIVAAGAALAYSALPLLVIRAVPDTETAAANSLNTLMRQLGMATCAALAATIQAGHAARGGTAVVTAPVSYTIVFAIAAGAALVAAVLALLTPAPRGAWVHDLVPEAEPDPGADWEMVDPLGDRDGGAGGGQHRAKITASTLTSR